MGNTQTIMIIAGGTWQVPLIRRAKELGYTVVNSNLYPDSIGFQYADYGEVADVLDKEKNLEIARKYNINAVLTDQSDIAVPTVAYVADQLGLPTIGEDMARLFTDKYEMRRFCMQNGFATPEFALCTSEEDVLRFVQDLGCRIIIKPVDSQSSRGVYEIVPGQKNIRELVLDAQHYSRDKKSVIAERYINGTEFTIDGMVTKKGHQSLCISQKDHYSYNENIASELLFTNSNAEFDYGELRAVNNRLVDLSGLPFGLTHAEYKYENGNYYLIEIAARGGGTKISSDIVPLMSGVDNYDYLFECALGKADSAIISRKAVPEGRSCVLKFLDIAPNVKPIREIRGIDEIRSHPEIIDFGLDLQVGDYVRLAQDDRSRVGYFIACADTLEDLRTRIQWVETTLQIKF